MKPGRRLLTLAAALVPVMLAGASAAPAQQEVTEWQQVVLDQLAAFDEAMLERDYHPVVLNVLGSAAQGERQRITVTLIDGVDYGVGAFCDRDCSDIDLRLYDQAGRELLSDLEPDDYPALDLSAQRTEAFEVELDMVTCTAEPCFYGLSLYATTPPSGTWAHSATGRLANGDRELNSGEFFDYHVFRAEAGQSIVVDMTSSDFDTYLLLRDPENGTTPNDDWQGSLNHSRIELEAGTSGTWAVIATSNKAGETGEYALDITVTGGKAAVPRSPEHAVTGGVAKDAISLPGSTR